MRNHYPKIFHPGLLLVTAMAFAGALAWPSILQTLTGVAVPETRRQCHQLASGILVLSALLYGLGRATRFHPLLHGGYLAWLRTTPWTRRDPLPLAPLTLVWQDALPLGLLTLAAAWHGTPEPWAVPATFGVAYLLATATSIAGFGGKAAALALFAGVPVVFLREVTGWWTVAVVAALYPAAVAGIYAMLGKFPWDDEPTAGALQPAATREDLQAKQKLGPTVGWPFAPLAPVPPPRPVRLAAALVGCALVGWWAFVLLRLAWPAGVPQEDERQGRVMLLAAGVVLALVRLARYAVGHAAPIKLLGRVVTGRLVIPGYDVIFVAPLCVLLAAFELPRLLPTATLGLPVVVGLVLPTLLLLVLLIGPTVADWRLTGDHRLYPTGGTSSPVRRNAGAAAAARDAEGATA